MEAEELTNDMLALKNIIPTPGDLWATFEVIENEELGKWFSYQLLLNSFTVEKCYFCGIIAKLYVILMINIMNPLVQQCVCRYM